MPMADASLVFLPKQVSSTGTFSLLLWSLGVIFHFNQCGIPLRHSLRLIHK